MDKLADGHGAAGEGEAMTVHEELQRQIAALAARHRERTEALREAHHCPECGSHAPEPGAGPTRWELAEALAAATHCLNDDVSCNTCEWATWRERGLRGCQNGRQDLLAACRAAGLLPEGGRERGR